MVLAAHLQEWPAEDAWGKNKKQVQNEFLPYQPASEMKAEPALTSGTFFLIVMPQEFFWCGISICMPFLLFEECISLPLGLVWQQGGAAPIPEQGRQKTDHSFTTAYEIQWEMITH